MKKKLFRRFVGVFLALLMVIEPVLLPVLRAEESYNAPATEVDDPISNFADSIYTPKEKLDDYFEAYGKTLEDIESRAWSDWFQVCFMAYLGLDDGASDALSFYEGLKLFKKIVSAPKDYLTKPLTNVAKYTIAAVGVLKKVTGWLPSGSRASNTNKAFEAFGKFKDFLEKGKEKQDSKWLFSNLSYFSVPEKVTKTSKNFGTNKTSDAYWKWLKKEQGVPEGEKLTNLQGGLRTAGIALSVLTFALDAYKLVSDEDFAVGRVSKHQVENTISVVLDALTIAAMFIPGLGEVMVIINLIYKILTFIFDTIGELHKRWKDAYYSSYWYLHENDAAFKTYEGEIDGLSENEKSDSYLLVTDVFKEQATEEDGAIYKTLYRQGVLSSYYGREDYELGSFDVEFLQKLFDAKQNYMAYKPTEEEAKEAEDRGILGSILHALNPVTHIKYIADAFASDDYEDLIKDKDLKPVYFNPDYILLKRYRNYVTNNNLTDDLFKVVGLRIELSPFNYLPLVGVDGQRWSADLIGESLMGDAFMCGEKELSCLANVVKGMNDEVKKNVKELNKKADNIKLMLDYSKNTVKFYNHLKAIAAAYEYDPDEVADSGTLICHLGSDDLYKAYEFLYDRSRFRGEGDSKKLDKKEVTAKKIVETFKTDIENILLLEPLSIGYRAVEMIIYLDTAKGMMDKSAIMKNYHKERELSYKNFDDEFIIQPIKDYIKEGKFLNHEGNAFLDWLSEDYSCYEETGKYLKIFSDGQEKYQGHVNDLKVSKWQETIKSLNEELEKWEGLVEKYEAIDEIDVAISSIKDQVFVDGGYKLPYSENNTIEPLNPEKVVAEN